MSSILCPKCRITTSPFTQEADLVFDRCETCKGIWLDRGELSRVSGNSEDFPTSVPSGLSSSRFCPKCPPKTALTEIIYTKESKILVDYCGSCSGLWLDHKELPKVLSILREHRIEMKKKKLLR